MRRHGGFGPRGRFVCAVAGIGVLVLSAAPVFGAKWKPPTEAEKQIVEDPAKGWTGAVYLERIYESAFDGFKTTVRAKILSKNGYDIGNVENLAADAHDIEGRTISPTGAITELSKNDIRKTTTVKAAGFSLQHKSFTMPALEPGCFIEYSYTQFGAFGPDSAYHTEIPFQDKYAILKQELRTPKVFPYSSSLRLQNGVKIDMKDEGSQYVYSAANMPASREEVYGLSLNERAAEVIFAYVFPGIHAKTADEFWSEATKKIIVPFLKKTLAKPAKVADRLHSIPGSRLTDPAARLKAIYHYVQTTVKNRGALRAGETAPKDGWKKNDDATDTLAHGDGSRSDLAEVFVSLLRADGWKCRPVFVSARESRLFRRDIPSVFQFDGWIVEVFEPGHPETGAFFSFAHPLLPFGVVPWNHTGLDGLAIDLDEESSSTAFVPAPAAEANRTHRVWTMSLDETGDAHVYRVSQWLGYPAFSMRAELYRNGKAEWERDVRAQYEKLDPPGKIESFAFSEEENPEATLQGTIRILRPGIATPLPGGRIELTPLPMLRYTNPFSGDKRNDPISFPYPYVDEDIVTVAPPAGYVVEGLPSGAERVSNVGRYSVTVKKGDADTVVLTRSFSVLRANSGAELYPNYRGLFDAARSGDAGISIVFRKAPGTPKARS